MMYSINIYEQNFGMEKDNLKHNNLIPIHNRARLDVES